MPEYDNVISKEAALTELRLARAGGGGSDSDSDWGSDSDWSSSSDWGSGSSGSSGPSRPMTPAESIAVGVLTISFLVIVAAVIWAARWQTIKWAKQEAARRRALEELGAKDPAVWDKAALDRRISEVFLGFQKAWSDLDAEAMKNLLTEDYYRRAVLEINVLYNQKRRNAMSNVALFRTEIVEYHSGPDDAANWFKASIRASADDALIDIAADNKKLFSDSSTFVEYWTFRREGGLWKLALIEQATASARYAEYAIAEFSRANGFYYDPDFGWLMMPNRGTIFNSTNFGKSDINNHVIGFYRDKIVEFYSYRPDKTNKPKVNYVVAQAILPISYHDILVSKRGWFERCPKGLEEHSLESPDFNKKYLVCAHPEDNIGTLELLTPNFMVHVEELTYDMNIEVVDNVLYFYTLDRRCSYDQMLQLLSYAFDEMKK